MPKVADHGIWPITSWEIDGKTVETVADFILGAPKSLHTDSFVDGYSISSEGFLFAVVDIMVI